MASGTRSGQVLKHKGNNSSRSETVGGKGKDVKAASASGSTGTSTKNKVECSTPKDVKSSTTSGSAATDSSSFRRSTRETPSKKMREPSPSSWKSERLEKESPIFPSDKKLEKVDNKLPHIPVPSDKKLEKVDKKRPQSPVRRSERIEKHGTPGSSSSKKGKYSSSSPGKKKKNIESEKTTVSGTVEQSKNKIQDIKSSRSSKKKKKKKMNARCYRALLLPSKHKAKSADADIMNLKDDTASRSNSCDSGSVQSSGFKQVHKDGDECNGREEEKVRWKHSDNDSKDAREIPSSGSRVHAELTLENNERRKPIRLRGKRKFKETSPVSNSSGSSSQSSREEKEINGKDDRLKLEASELVASTSEGKALASVTSPEFGGDFGGSKSKKMVTNLDSDISVTPTNKEFANPDASAVEFSISSPFRSKSENSKQCNVCCKPQRVCNGSLPKEMCSCKLGSRNDLLISSSEKACEAVSTSRDPYECERLPTGSQENKATGVRKTEAGEYVSREYVSLPEKENFVVASADTKYVSVPMTEDRGRFGVIDGVGIAEDRLNSTHLKKNSLANQTDSWVNACLLCKNPGRLLCCNGKDCKRSYHLSCLNPPLQEVPVGGWLCHFCVKKKLELGVHSVSEGIESVWDVREGMQNGRQYFVKYKGLAHVHNLWIPECQLLLEAPNLLAKFNRKHQKEKVTRWKQDWTKPHRLLQKRLLIPKNLSDECISLPGDELSHCSHEWFVKWKGLGYESASWELENSSILCSPEAAILIKDYERRREEAKRTSEPSRADKALQVKKDPFQKLTRLPDECPAILDNDHLNSINRLREFWHKSHNAVLIDDQERIVKSVLFIAALFSHTCRPFLVISTISSLSLWESEFMRLAPSANVVVYNWDKEIRRMIRTLEFYDEGGCVMFRVLVSHPDAIIEDFEDVNCIAWEAVFVDLYQNSRISKHLEQLKCLTTDFRLLLLSGHLKDSVAEYVNFLSFLDSGGKENGTSSLNVASDDSTCSLAILKERFARYLAYERRLDTGKFVEYWVPVRLSNVQLEQYCATLVANSIALLSCPKVDQTGAFRDILISTRKCCDHPYLVDKQLQSSLTKGLPADRFLDIGVKASGKLFLLDKILQETKKQGLRVLILFQSIGGAGRNPIGDILDDFIRQRYGADSYERIDSGLVMSKKVAALNMFNDKKNGRFVFLIENRACLPSVKLSSVDVVIIYDSDWNPLNDLRALQRVTIESQFEHVKVFRLYSSCTVEEKVLIFAKKDMILESNIQNISPSNSHMLLSWGALYLFSKLDEFHQVDNLSNHSEPSIDLLIVNDAIMKFVSEVMFEVLSQLPGKSESCSTGNCSILVKAMQSGASYSRNISLIGEQDGIASLDKDPPSFWSNLLENRYPKWRFVSGQSQRSRKRPQHFDVESKKVTEVGNDEARRKHRKLSLNTEDPITLQNWLQDRTKGTSVGKDSMVNDTLKSHVSNSPASVSPQKTLFNRSNMLKEPEAYESQVYVQSQCTKSTVDIVNDVNRNRHVSSKFDESSELHYSPTVESERRKKLLDLQSSLHLSLKPELEKLCDVLKLPEEVKSLAQIFLEYVMNNHKVSREPETTLQAFKISLCWRAASFLKHKVDHRECLALAKKYLNFVCDVEEAASVYSKLRMLKKQFSQTSSFESKKDLNSSQNHLSVSRTVDVDQQLHVEASNSMQSNQPELGEIREISDGPRSSEQLVLEQQQDPVHESHSRIQQNLGSLQDVLLKKRVDLIHEICSKRAEDLLLKQQVEISDFNVHREEEKINLKTAHDSDVDLIRSIHIDHIIRNNKIKLLNQIYLKKMDKYDQHMKSQRSKLAAMQKDARNKEDEIRDRWLEEAKAGSLKESFDNLPLTESGFRLEEFKIVSSQFEACDGAGNMIAPRPASDQFCSNMRETCQGESNELVVEHPESPSLLHIERVEDMLVETEIPACKTLSIVQLDSAEPTGASVSTSNPHKISDYICTAGSGESTELSIDLLKVPSDIPSGRIEDLPMDVDNVVSQSEKRVRGECVEPPGSSQSISTTLPSPTIGRLSMETEITPSQSDTMSAEGNVVDAVLIDSVLGTPAITADRDLEGGDNTDNTHSISSPQQIQAEVQSDITNAVSTGSDPMLIASTRTMLAPTSVGGDTHEGEANHDISCLIASLQKNQAEFALPLPSLTSSGCDVSVTSNQISSVCEHERLALTGATRPDQGDSSSQQITIPASDPVNGVPSPVKQTTHNTGTLNSTSSEVPASVDISLTENGQTNNDVPLEYEGEPCTFTNSFAPQTEVSLLQPISGAVALGEETNQFVPSSGVPPLPPNSGTRLERTPPEHLAGGQSEPGSQVSQLLSWLPVPLLGSDPLQNELMRIRKQDELCTKKHDAKKVQLELERDQEIERIRRKYEVLLQDAEIEFVHDKKILETVYNKVLLNRILAEEFRAKFIENKGTAASFPGPRPNTAHQFLPASHTPRTPRQPSTSSPTLTPNSANLPVLQTPARTPSTRPPVGPRAMVSVPPCPMVRNTPLYPTNQVRSHFSPVLPPRMNNQLGTEARAPAPHLVRFRPPTSTPVTLPLQASQVSVQQQPVPNLGSATIIAPITPTPRAPLSGTYHQPVVPAVSPVSHSVTLSAFRLPRDGHSSPGADVPNLTQSIDVGPSLDGLLPTNLPPKENESTPSSSDASRAAAATAEDVVCISDEE